MLPVHIPHLRDKYVVFKQIKKTAPGGKHVPEQRAFLLLICRLSAEDNLNKPQQKSCSPAELHTPETAHFIQPDHMQGNKKGRKKS